MVPQLNVEGVCGWTGALMFNVQCSFNVTTNVNVSIIVGGCLQVGGALGRVQTSMFCVKVSISFFTLQCSFNMMLSTFPL